MATQPRPVEPPEPRGVHAYAAEVIGTFMLVLFIALYLTVSQKVLAATTGGFSLASLALLHAFVLAVLVYTLGGTSGAHFNPAVTLALATLRKISAASAAVYMVCQLVGATLAALVCKLVLTDEGNAVHYGATLVNHQAITTAGGLLIEIIGTFTLMWAIMGTAVNPRGSKAWAGWVIGIALGLGVIVAGPLTGAGFNPARSFGPALVSGTWTNFWIYIVGPAVGALLAAGGYHFLEIAPKDRLEQAPIQTLD